MHAFALLLLFFFFFLQACAELADLPMIALDLEGELSTCVGRDGGLHLVQVIIIGTCTLA